MDAHSTDASPQSSAPTAQAPAEPGPAPPPEAPPSEAPAAAPESGAHAGPHGATRAALGKLVLGALGVVYGDIGTSPLYALKECFTGTHGIPPDRANVFGVLSLVFWSL